MFSKPWCRPWNTGPVSFLGGWHLWGPLSTKHLTMKSVASMAEWPLACVSSWQLKSFLDSGGSVNTQSWMLLILGYTLRNWPEDNCPNGGAAAVQTKQHS